jgi:hypothetical protein
MASTSWKLRAAQNEVQRTARSQDLIEVPKRAQIDRETESLVDELPTPGNPPKSIKTPV